MPNNGHDSSSREIFSSPHGLLQSSPDTSGGLDHAAGARNSGPFILAKSSAFPASADQSFQPAAGGAVVAWPRPATAGVGQDKGALESAPKGTEQPAPGTNGARSSLGTTSSPHVQVSHTKEKLQRASIWMRPGLKVSMREIAEQDGFSFSAACATALEVYARQKIHQQEETLFEPRFRKIVRQEIRASDNRHIYFEMKNAIAAEQTRILTADLYKRELQKDGLSQEQIHDKLDQAYRLARTNILKKTPQLQSLLDEWWAETDEATSGDKKAVTGKT